ncbi:MAG: preprotein translocase subunit YajC [Deltaproteobacteria bacterium RBG_16_71_12]|nr:MAG: preprotein translocase subunit YajC [Deltaproteobacteria bacterium RBG_16_71_12]
MGETVQSLVAQAGGGGAGLLGMLPFLVGMFAIMYFLMIRPERKRQAEQQNLLTSLKKGDEVVLTSGFVGKIQQVDERTVVLEIADKTRVKVLKQAVMGPAARFVNPPADAKKLEEKKDDKKDATGAPSGAPTAIPDDEKSEKKSA